MLLTFEGNFFECLFMHSDFDQTSLALLTPCVGVLLCVADYTLAVAEIGHNCTVGIHIICAL